MAWLTIHDAAQALRCSERTIHRRMAAGRIDATRDNGSVLVRVPDDLTDKVSEAVGHLSEVSTAAAVERVEANETVGVLTRELGEVRKLYADCMLRDAREVDRARRVSVLSLTATVVCLALLAGFAVTYHRNRVQTVSQMANLTHERDAAIQGVTAADRRASEAEADRDQVLDAHLAGYGFQVAGR